jgi:hypothetical protein
MAEPYVPVATYDAYNALELALDNAVAPTKVYTDSISANVIAAAASAVTAATQAQKVQDQHILFLVGC